MLAGSRYPVEDVLIILGVMFGVDCNLERPNVAGIRLHSDDLILHDEFDAIDFGFDFLVELLSFYVQGVYHPQYAYLALSSCS